MLVLLNNFGVFMAYFPKQFVEQAVILEPGIGERGDAALQRLKEKGFSVGVGLSEYYAGAIGVMGYQKHIREYCPKDATKKRFGTLPSTAQWLQKNGGRGMFTLLHGDNPDFQLDGYGWTGVETCDELPDHPITSAYRLGERAVGKGLAGDFVQVVVSGTHTLFAHDEGIGLETWRSNRAASLYPKVGFVPIAEAPEDEFRPKLDPTAPDGQVLDRRLYMGYPNELLG
jgi:hypothetical protein